VEAVLQKQPSLLIFNLERVDFVSSAGIGVVLAAEKVLKAHGGKALLVQLKPHIRKVFDIVRALPSQQIFGSTAELDEYLANIQRQVRDGKPE
jgi:anti-anti-sigma factor